MISVFSTTLQDEELTEGVTYLHTKETGLQHDKLILQIWKLMVQHSLIELKPTSLEDLGPTNN